jgi:hypothetical protein
MEVTEAAINENKFKIVFVLTILEVCNPLLKVASWGIAALVSNRRTVEHGLSRHHGNRDHTNCGSVEENLFCVHVSLRVLFSVVVIRAGVIPESRSEFE